MSDDLLEILEDFLRKRKELMLDEEEIRFISAVVGGYVFSPPDIRAVIVPKFKVVIKEAFDMLQQRMAEKKAKGGERISN